MSKICHTSEITNSTVIKIQHTDSQSVHEAVIVEFDEKYFCWLNYCQHITTVKLDDGDGITDRNDEIVCTNHGAMFNKQTGYCTFGPCKGAYLSEVQTEVKDDEIYLTDSMYTLVSSDPESSTDNTLSRSTVGESDFQ